MKKYNVPALEKTLAILDLLAESENELSITEIHTQLNMPKASVFMIMNVLEQHQVVMKNKAGRYSIGVKLYNLGMSYLTQVDFKKIAHPFLEELNNETGFTSHLGVLVDNKVMFIDKVEQKSFIKFSTFEGMRSDVHISSLGKAIVAYLPEEEVDEILGDNPLGKYTPNTITSKEVFKNILPSIRETGYAIEDEEGELGVRCIGSAIFNHEGKVEGAISITAIRTELLMDIIPEIGEKVKKTAEKISKQLGYQVGMEELVK